MQEETLELDECKFSVTNQGWLKIYNIGISLLNKQETQELIDFLQKHLHEIRE